MRPVLIVQNEIGNRHSPTVIAAAITSRLDKARLPTHINIRAADTGLAKDSVVLLEQIRTLDKHRLRERAGQITPADQKRVDQPGRQSGAYLLLTQTPCRWLRQGRCTRQVKNKKQAAPWKGGGKRCCLLYGNP